MPAITLEQMNENILELKKEIKELKEYIHEDFELADDVKEDIEDSRKRLDSEFVPHEEVMKRYS